MLSYGSVAVALVQRQVMVVQGSARRSFVVFSVLMSFPWPFTSDAASRQVRALSRRLHVHSVERAHIPRVGRTLCSHRLE